MAKKQSTRVILIAVIAILLAGAFLINKFVLNRAKIPDDEQVVKMAASRPASSGALPVTVAIAQIDEIPGVVAATGELLANEEVEITSEVAGKVIKIYFQEGSPVSKDQMLVKLNDDDLQAQLKRLQFQEVTLAEKLERQRILFEKEAISREAYDQVQTEHNVLLADIELIKVRIDKTEIRAPFGGTMGFRFISEGSYLQPGGQIARLVDYSTLKLEFAISERFVGEMAVGRVIYFSLANQTAKYNARIYAVEPHVDQNTRTTIMRALFDNSAGQLRPGMSVWVDLSAGSEKGLMVPTEAIVPNIDGMNVWLVRNGKPVMVPVQVGARTPNKVEISEGVQVGDSVVVTGIMQIREGIDIQVMN